MQLDLQTLAFTLIKLRRCWPGCMPGWVLVLPASWAESSTPHPVGGDRPGVGHYPARPLVQVGGSGSLMTLTGACCSRPHHRHGVAGAEPHLWL